MLIATDFELTRVQYEYSNPGNIDSEETLTLIRTLASVNDIELLDYDSSNSLPLILGLSIGIPVILVVGIVLWRRRRVIDT